MKIVLFDGICNLCNSSVKFIIKHDSKAIFYFASQQSNYGKDLIKKHKLENFDSIILIKDDIFFLYSDAALEISKELDRGLSYIYIFRFIPKWIRDKIYKLIAKYRYVIFGKKEHCMIPSLEIKSRFLD